MRKVATQPLPLGGSPPLHSGGQNQRWPTSGQGGYIIPAALGIPSASQPGAKSEVAHKWARWLHYPCHLGGPYHFTTGGQNRWWPTSAQGGYTTPAAWGSPPLQSGAQNQRWPTSGQGGYSTPAALGIPSASEPGAKLEVAHKWARWLHNRCRLGGPHRFKAGGKIRSGPQVGKVAT